MSEQRNPDTTCSHCGRDMSTDPWARCSNGGYCVSISVFNGGLPASPVGATSEGEGADPRCKCTHAHSQHSLYEGVMGDGMCLHDGCDCEMFQLPWDEPLPVAPPVTTMGKWEGLPPLRFTREGTPVYFLPSMNPERREKLKKQWAKMDEDECNQSHYKHYEWMLRSALEQLEIREQQLLATLSVSEGGKK